MNNEKYDDWFNKTFDEAFESAASTTSLPDHDTKRESWLQVKQQLATNNTRKQRRRRFQFSGIIAASMAMGAILFSPPNITQAVSPIYQQIREWGDGLVTIISGKDEPAISTVPKTNAPPEGIGPEETNNIREELLGSSTSEQNNLSLDEVQSRLSFSYPEFQYIPKGYHYSDVLTAPMNDEAQIHDMSIQYISDDGKILNISFVNLSNGPVSVSTPSSLTSKKLQLRSGLEALFTEGRVSSLQFINDNIMIRIVGELSKEELLKIANSLP